MQTMPATNCPQCGTSFECCPQPDQRCWCLDLPPLPANLLGKEAAGCYCPACLRARLAAAAPEGQKVHPGAPS